MKFPKPNISQSFSRRLTFKVLVTVFFIYATLLAVIFCFTSLVLMVEEGRRLGTYIDVIEMRLKGDLHVVEAVVHNNTPDVAENLDDPQVMYELTSYIVELNPLISGSAIAFEPNYFKNKGKYYAAYAYRDSTGTIQAKQLGQKDYDYFQMDWYKKPKETGEPCWSEPYFDQGGGEMAMVTYSYPLKDAKGEVYAVITADMTLDQLTQSIDIEPLRDDVSDRAYFFIISKKGTIISHPNKDYVLTQNIADLVKQTETERDNMIIKEMMEGKSKWRTIKKDGEIKFVSFDSLHDVNGWSMAVVCPLVDILAPALATGIIILIIMAVGVILLFVFTHGTIKSVTRPLELFAQSADEVAKGNFQAKLPIIITKDEMRRLHDSFKAMQMSLTSHMEQLKTVNEAKGRIESELQIAHSIQMSMLPKTFPPYPERNDIDIYGALTPAKEVGGDLYDFFLRDEKLFFCIGDVSGKGVPASLVMAVSRTLFRNIAAHTTAPDRIVYALNNAISDGNESNMFVTFFVGVLDLPTGRLRFCNAGHESPLLIGDEGIGYLPCEPNLPVGIEADWKFVPQEVVIHPNTTIFLYTDGLTEAENISHEQFQEQRIIDAAQQADRHPKELLEQMTTAVHQFVGGAEQSDDLTMLAIQYTHEQDKNLILQRDLSLPNDVEQVPRLAAFVEEVCETVGFDMSTTMSLNLALEEAVVNVMDYAYPMGTVGEINVSANCNVERLKFTITDWGIPFDPTAKQEVDTTLSLEERPVGGLGIHLVRQIMDSINYERVNNKNVLTLRKYLAGFALNEK